MLCPDGTKLAQALRPAHAASPPRAPRQIRPHLVGTTVALPPEALQHPAATTGGGSVYNRIAMAAAFLAGLAAGSLGLFAFSQEARRKPPARAAAPPDAIAEAQTPKEVPVERPEQKKTA